MKEVEELANQYVREVEENYTNWLDQLKVWALQSGALNLFARRHDDAIREDDRLNRWVPDHEEEQVQAFYFRRLKDHTLK